MGCRCSGARWRWRSGACGCDGVFGDEVRSKKLEGRRTAKESGGPSLMDATIVVVGAAARVDVELLAHAVDLPLQVAVLDFRHRMHPPALQVHIAHRQAAKMRDGRDAARVAERREQG